MAKKMTALYERLSHDDEHQGESYSISNQKKLLEQYAEDHDLKPYVHFFDDGISGTRFDRPGFLEMMQRIEEGQIDTVIIKDMSRLGRDYLVVGQLQEMMRQKGVRLIAINDNHDSANGDDDFIVFKNLMNEWYAKDTSKKIRSTFQTKGKSGKHVASICPYGYLKDEKDGNIWHVDPLAADIVRKIYAWTIDGMGPYQIAKRLKEEKVEIPAVHMARYNQGLNRKKPVKDPYGWGSSTVVGILKKREYLGHTVNFKTTPTMINEFIDKILVHERDRKGSIDCRQEIEIYFSFIGRYIPPHFGEVNMTPEEEDAYRKREAKKDRLHQNYLKRKAKGEIKAYEERTKDKYDARLEKIHEMKDQLRQEDIAKGIFIPVSMMEPQVPTVAVPQ